MRTSSGTTLINDGGGVYRLAAASPPWAAELDALVFTPTAGAPGSSTPTTFALSDTSQRLRHRHVDGTTTVINTIRRRRRPSAERSPDRPRSREAHVHPFSGVTIADPNSGATDTLTITLSNSVNGTLSGTALINDGGGV